MRLIEDWRRVLARAWSIRVAALWVAVGVFFTAGLAFSDTLSAIVGAKTAFVMVSLAGVSFGIARLLGQKGADDAP